MLKKGFTLMEILIAMALVGILAAVVSPNIARISPHKQKALFIKAYTRTEIAISNLINDAEIYPTVYEPGEGKFLKFGLCNQDEPIGTMAKNGYTGPEFTGAKKLSSVFAIELGGIVEAAEEGATTFTVATKDNLKYKIESKNANNTTRTANAATIVVELDGEKLGTITVRNDGLVDCGDDACTKYLEDRYNLQRKY